MRDFKVDSRSSIGDAFLKMVGGVVLALLGIWLAWRVLTGVLSAIVWLLTTGVILAVIVAIVWFAFLGGRRRH